MVAGADALPFADARFTAIVSVNSVYFWPDVPAGLAELRRILAPGGPLVLAIESASALADSPLTAAFANTDPHALRALVEAAGFASTRVEELHRGARLVVGIAP